MFLKLILITMLSLFSVLNSQKIEKSPLNYYSPECPLDNNLRKHSLPFITGDTFRFFSDHVYDEARSFDPLDVKPGDTVFVSGWYLKSFFEVKHPSIKNEYVLITGNSDVDIDEYFLPYLKKDSKLRYFFATNAIINHQRLIGVPIGLSNSYWKHGDSQVLAMIAGNFAAIEKKYLLSLNFTTNTNPVYRLPIYDFFVNKNYCKIFINRNGSNMKNYANYLKDLSESYFTISPIGNGFDCHRVWEACWVGCIPVVQSSALDNLYKDLPILIVDDFFKITEKLLKQKLVEIRNNLAKNNFNMDKLYFAYWIAEIRKKQAQLRI